MMFDTPIASISKPINPVMWAFNVAKESLRFDDWYRLEAEIAQKPDDLDKETTIKIMEFGLNSDHGVFVKSSAQHCISSNEEAFLVAKRCLLSAIDQKRTVESLFNFVAIVTMRHFSLVDAVEKEMPSQSGPTELLKKSEALQCEINRKFWDTWRAKRHAGALANK